MKIPLRFRFDKVIGSIEIFDDEVLRKLVKIKALEHGKDLDECYSVINFASIDAKGNLTYRVTTYEAP